MSTEPPSKESIEREVRARFYGRNENEIPGSLVRIERKLDLILEKMGIQVAKNSEGKILATPKQISFIKDLAGQVGVSVNDGELKKLSVEEASAMITDLKLKRAAKWSMK